MAATGAGEGLQKAPDDTKSNGSPDSDLNGAQLVLEGATTPSPCLSPEGTVLLPDLMGVFMLRALSQSSSHPAQKFTDLGGS